MAPGLRVGVSSRGLRTSIGPRAARLHVGGGSPGFSSGVGPVSVYAGLGGGARGGGGGHRPSAAPTRTTQQPAATGSREQQIAQLHDEYRRIESQHRQSFPAAQRPASPPLRTVDETAIRQHFRELRLHGVSVFARSRRKAALAQAEVDAEQAIADRQAQAAADQRAAQASLDDLWGRLVANDPAVVIATLRAAFGDNEAAAAPLGVEGDEAALLVLVPTASAMPAKKPDLTPTGRPTLKTVPKKEAADWHKAAVCGAAVVTVKEAFAVAPGLQAARIVAVALPDIDAYGQQRPEVLLAARVERQRLEHVHWVGASAVRVINDTTSELQLRQVGVTKALAPVDLADEPQLRALLDGFDYGDLAED